MTQYKENIFIKILLNNFKDKLLCPIISSFIIIGIVFLVFSPLVSQTKLNLSEAVDAITVKMDQQIRSCGPNYWTSWIIVDESRKQFKFQDVRGFNADGTTIISSKSLKLNPYYLKKHSIDDKTISFLSNFETGAAGHYENISFFDEYLTAKEIIGQSNKKPITITISVTRNIFSNIVYVFLATTLSPNFDKCDKSQIVNNLEDLSIYAKGTL